MAAPNNRFAFDSNNLISFCKRSDMQECKGQSEAILELRMKDLDGRWIKVEKSYEDLMLSDQSQEIKTTAQEQYEVCVDVYYMCMSKILDFIKPNKEPLDPRVSLGSTVPNTSEDVLNTCLKLPPCDTQIFAGSYEEWPPFRDMFTAVYINHPRLTSAEKLYHLRNKTKDTAGAIVKRFPLTDENFNLAWQALKSRYENVRVLVDNQIRNLFNIPLAVVEDSDSLQRIHSSVTDCLSMLETLGVSAKGWDPLLVNLVYSKLPHETLAQWEQSLNACRELPKWSQLSNFLLQRCEIVERISTIKLTKSSFPSHYDAQSRIQTYASQEKLNINCKMCNEEHGLRICPQFRKLSVQERVDFVFKNQCCNNCLSVSHIKTSCKSKNTCLNCGKKHHTLLHMRAVNNSKKSVDQSHNENSQSLQAKASNSQAQIPNSRDNQKPETSNLAKLPPIHSNYATNNTNILLRTALVQIESRGEHFTIRALIDPGSERTFISEKIRKRLSLPYKRSRFEIIGVGGQSQIAEKECDLVLVSQRNKFRFQITAIVLPKVTNKIPSSSFKINDPSNLSDIELADPYFNVSSSIDLILGNDSERYINLDGIKRDVCGSASAYNTVFGWVLSGPVQTKPIFSFSSLVTSTEHSNINDLLRKFWEQEEIPMSPAISSEDEYCEEFYVQTTKRLADGRYMVRLPFRKEFPNEKFLGPSRFMALGQYVRMEQTLSKDLSLSLQYNEVLNEYITLGHMEETTSCEYFLENKCNSFYLPHHAVVRPESKTTKVRVVFNASRKSKSGFSLNDVLYTGPTLQADLMSVILNWRFYRYVFSGDIQKMYRQILIDPIDRPFQRILFQKSPRDPVKDYELKTVTFGINCAPFLAIRTLLQLASDIQDQFPKASTILRHETYVDDILAGGHSIESAIQSQEQLIKSLKSANFNLKKITSNDSRLLKSFPKEDLYDSNFLKFHDSSSTKTLGIRWNALTDSFTYSFEPILKATTITKRQILSSVAKLFDPAGWISPIVIRGKILIQQLWLERIDWDEPVSADSLRTWNELINDLPSVEKIRIPRWIQFTPVDCIQIHGFCDASKMAYCAAVYIRVQTSRTVFTNLLVSKSKVAPLDAITLPRLELSGAVMLAKLTNHTISSLELNQYEVVLWCDSSIVLGWLAKPPATWKEIYVSNRVSKIHKLIPNAKWRHVPTHYNPADLGSRGCRPQDLYSSTEISQKEANSVKIRLIILAQKQWYKYEYSSLSNSESIPKDSSLFTLNPFIDANGVLRVNGRLANAPLSYNERFPIILPRNSHFCELFLAHLHEFLAHGECHLMCRMLQTQFYIPRLKLRIRKLIRYCKTCIIHKRKSCSQIMAALPSERCTLSSPFHTTGIDFAGPFELKNSTLKNASTVKGYVCVFVCFATKAVHLEPCSNLSTAAFQATFARFVGRRGLPHKIVSDNGRNFVGASRAFRKEFLTFLKTVSHDIAQKYLTHGFEWSFIPPHAPHMGGLWEAAVKSFKFHLKRVAGAHRFTFEEFTTVLSRIEGVLNSRPISALSEDPTDLTALTPGHFLRGGPMLAIPEPTVENLSLISRWEKLKAIHHQFAIQWKEDYLKSLHKRYKWKFSEPNLKIDDFVIIIDDILPPNEWRYRNQPPRNPDVHQCQVCYRYHSLRFCRSFLAMNSTKRNQVVRQKQYCLNCLARTHIVRKCESPDKCKKCGLLHHTLLHPTRHPRGKAQHTNIRERIGSRSQVASRTNTKLRGNSQHHQSQAKDKAERQPNQWIISEAIRTLAAVLCTNSTTS
ncbi:uncharacterized protein LOC135953245 [Calliphora vicina]|uniref:uncharacterized protein LOC135953245 n=1 Tax=Calliphora vicina TaxID=7373 RepID=UPI00325BDBD2